MLTKVCQHPIKLWCSVDDNPEMEMDGEDALFSDPTWNDPDGWGNKGAKPPTGRVEWLKN